MSILSKGHKPDNYQSHKYLKMSFANVSSLYSNFAECKSLLESSSPDIFALWETKLDDSIDSSNFSVRFYLPLIQGYSHPWSCSLCEGEISFLHGTYL